MTTPVIAMSSSPIPVLIHQDNELGLEMFDYFDNGVNPRLYERLIGYDINQLDRVLKGKTKSFRCAVVSQDPLEQVNWLDSKLSRRPPGGETKRDPYQRLRL